MCDCTACEKSNPADLFLIWRGLVRSEIVLVANAGVIKFYLVLENLNKHGDLAEGCVSSC